MSSSRAKQNRPSRRLTAVYRRGFEDGRRAALSAAEPVAWLVKRYDLEGILLDTELGFVRPTIRGTCRTDMEPLYAAPPARSVAVKALEWNPYRAETHFGWYQIEDQRSVPESELKGRPPFLLFGGRLDYSRHSTLEAARAAAQADYETRILSALSAQVQDVAGTETTTRFHIEWIAGARPPVHPNPMTGRTTFESFELAVQHMKSQADDAQFVSLEERRTTIVHIDRSADMRAALPAAPAKQEGGQ